MLIKVLGMGCANCQKLFEEAQKIVAELEIEAEVTKVEDPMKILSLGVMRTPALIIDGLIVHQGSVPSTNDLKAMIKEAS